MARLDLRMFIRATPQQVWDVISDVPAQATWMEDVRELRVVSEQKRGAGTLVKLTSDLFGLPLVHETMEISAWEPPHRLAVVHYGRGFSGSGAFELESALDGTVFYWWEEFKPPLRPLGDLAFDLFVGPSVRRVFYRSMENVRRLAEAASLAAAQSEASAEPAPARRAPSRRRAKG